MEQKKAFYIYSDELAAATSRIPNIRNRARVVHGLISAYDELISSVEVVAPTVATQEDILSFHSKEYYDMLCSASSSNDELNHRTLRAGENESDARFVLCSTSFENEDDSPTTEYYLDDYGLGYDCPLFADMVKVSSLIAGGTLTAAQLLIDGEHKVVINWHGGWHHAQRSEASGFCYVNDIVIGITHLLKKFNRILYVDFDVHHGDGVQNAFSYTNKVLTLSLHNYEPGFFPGTGATDEIGFGNKGKYHSVNIPLKSGITDAQYTSIFHRIFELIQTNFPFEATVIQVGADCITGDPLGAFNLTPVGLGNCIRQILKAGKPSIFLGGGGYNIPNSARVWTYLTSIILEKSISNDVPEHEYFPLYGPSFELDIRPGLSKNHNTPQFLESLYSEICENIKKLK